MKIKYLSLKNSGFTLIELMVVIAIIGILTAITTANFTQSKAKSRDAKRVSDLAQIQLTLEMAFDRCNKYPQSIYPESTIIDNKCVDSSGNKYALSYFISKMPTDTNGVQYEYVTNSSQTDYVLGTKFEDKNSVLTDSIQTFPSSINGGSFPSGHNCVQTSSAYYYCVVPK